MITVTFSSHIILRYHQAPPVALCDPVLPRLDASGTSSFPLVSVQQRMSPLRCNNVQIRSLFARYTGPQPVTVAAARGKKGSVLDVPCSAMYITEPPAALDSTSP